MVFNSTFNKISVILRRSVLLVEETRVPEEHHRPIASHWQTLSQNVIFIFIHISNLNAKHFLETITFLQNEPPCTKMGCKTQISKYILIYLPLMVRCTRYNIMW